MNETLLLARRAVREVWRLPAATIPALFMPVFFLVVNLGQVNRMFPSSMAADPARGVAVLILVLGVGFAFGARVKSGVAGVVLLILLAALWGVAYAGIAIAIALKTKNVQTTNASFIIFFPLLFLTPNFVPLELLAPPLRVLARINPVTYVIQGLRDLVLYPDIPWGSLGACVLNIVLTGVVLTGLSLRALVSFND